jgi:hypothetical protein
LKRVVADVMRPPPMAIGATRLREVKHERFAALAIATRLERVAMLPLGHWPIETTGDG